MSVVLDRPQTLLPGRFEWLMGLHAENYHRLTRLFGPQRLPCGVYVSSLDDGLDLRFEIVARHPYTLDVHLGYRFQGDDGSEEAPSAQVRLYTDAHMAEVLACHADRRLARAIGLLRPSRSEFQQRVRMGSFLNRWLEYLAGQGHSAGTLEPMPILTG